MDNSLIKTDDTIKVSKVNIQSRIDTIIELDIRVINILDKVKKYNYGEYDSRYLMLRYLNELHLSTIFMMSFQAECADLFKNKERFKSKLPHLKKNIDAARDFDKISFERFRYIAGDMKNFFWISYFTEFESRLRNIVRAIGTVPNVAKTKRIGFLTGSEPFDLIYRGLYEKYLNFKKKDYEALKMFSSIRNTIHNTGFYFNIRKEDLVFNYRDKTYHFVYGKPVNFLSDDFIKQLILDLLSIIERTLEHHKISSIKLIEDYTSKVKFRIEE